MKYRFALPVALFMGLALMVGCDDDPAGPTVTTDDYYGAVVDAVLAGVFAQIPGMDYDSTRMVYSISSDGSYEQVGQLVSTIPYGTVEVGSYATAGDVYTFTPTQNWKYTQAGAVVEVSPDSIRAEYTATMGAGNTLAIANYINIDDGRLLGPVTLTMQ